MRPRRRKSRRYAALPFLGASTPPGAATALRPLPGAKIGTCRYAAARRSAPLSLPVVLWPMCIRTACISAASDAIIFHRKWALCALAVFYIVHSVVFRKHGRCRICARRRRRKSRRYAALPYGRLRKPRAATALRPLPGAKIETCRYAAARRSAPLLHARPCIWSNRHQRGVTCIYIP